MSLWNQIYLELDLFRTRSTWNQIYLELDLFGTRSTWNQIYLELDLPETRSIWNQIYLELDLSVTRSTWNQKQIYLKLELDLPGTSRTDEGQPRPKYIFNKYGTNIYFFLLYRGLVHHHHRILNRTRATWIQNQIYLEL